MNGAAHGVTIVVGACAAASVARGAANKSRSQDDIDFCLSALESVGIGPNEEIESQVIRFVSRLRANFELTISGIMSETFSVKEDDVLAFLDDLVSVEWACPLSINVLDSIKQSCKIER